MIVELTEYQFEEFNLLFGGAYQELNKFLVSHETLRGVDRDALEEFSKSFFNQDLVDLWPFVYDDNVDLEMNNRKHKLAELFKSMEDNPYVDDTLGRSLLRDEASYVESYKYSAAGLDDLIIHLTKISLDTNDPRHLFLIAEVSPGAGITVLQAIGGALA